MINYVMNGSNVDKNKIERWACETCGIVVPAMTIYSRRYADDYQSHCPKCGGVLVLQEGDSKLSIHTKKRMKK